MITDAQLLSFAERVAVSFEKIARALEGLDETYRRQFQKANPEKKEIRDAVLTRIPSPEDRVREAQGASTRPIAEWLSELEDEEKESEFVGRREREWLEANPTPGQ